VGRRPVATNRQGRKISWKEKQTFIIISLKEFLGFWLCYIQNEL
jgi:hypothetical protein